MVGSFPIMIGFVEEWLVEGLPLVANMPLVAG